ncbi:MAG: methionyl-tRNA formyltransferase [Myxococcota bacterium]
MTLRIAIFGQAPFGKDVSVALAEAGHEVVGVHVPPDKGRPDPLAAEAEARGWPLFRYKAYRRKGVAIPERVEEYRALGADLNVMPFTTVILPPEIVDAPARGSLCFHPSILPAYRGGSAIPWQIILGAEETGVTVFQPDEGVDTGPIVVQRRGIPIAPTDNAASLYFDKIYPAGVEAMIEAVALVDRGEASPTPQSEQGASFQGLVDDEVARIDWTRPGAEIERLVRGCDPQPGARARVGDRDVRVYDARFEPGGGDGEPGTVAGVHDGRLAVCVAGGRLSLGKARVGDGKKGPAADSGLAAGDRLT